MIYQEKTEKAPISNNKNEKGDFSGGPVVKSRLPLQGTQVQFSVREDPTRQEATKPMCLHTTTAEAPAPRIRAAQQEKPLQWEAGALQWRWAPVHRN